MTIRFLLLAAAVLCFLVALLLALGAFTGGNETAWQLGGLLALALGLAVPSGARVPS